MKTKKQVLEETIEHLNKCNAKYLFEFNDLQLPLPDSAEETHYELYITRTGRENNKRERLIHWTCSCPPDKAAEYIESKCKQLVFDLLSGFLYHHDPNYRPPVY